MNRKTEETGVGNQTWAAAAALLLLAGCVLPGYVRDPAPWVGPADWSQAGRVRLQVSEAGLEPQVLTLDEGQAYVLQLVNTGRERQRLESENFYRALAHRRLRAPREGAAEVEGASGLEVEPGGTLELSFVAVRPGTYALRAAPHGFTGAVQIAPRPPAKP